MVPVFKCLVAHRARAITRSRIGAFGQDVVGCLNVGHLTVEL